MFSSLNPRQGHSMKIKTIRIAEYKRFTNLTISGLTATCRLVMVAGSNGNGKSSLFDAFLTLQKPHAGQGSPWEDSYHAKRTAPTNHSWDNAVKIDFHETAPNSHKDWRKLIYVRTAYRNESNFRVSSISTNAPSLDENRIQRLNQNDAAVSQNYQRLVSSGFEDAFERLDGGTTLSQFREETIGAVRDKLNSIFPNLKLNSFGNPLTEGSFRFSKGVAHGYTYENLSGGEKAIFDLLLDLHVKSKEFDNTIFCIDEPEAHVNPKLHSSLLDSLLDLIPPNCQLWVATHSVGMLKRAQELYNLDNEDVAFLDFDQDFDTEVMLQPTVPNRRFWKQSLEVAFADLASLVAPKTIVFCEGASNGTTQQINDAKILDAIFGDEFPDVSFLSLGSHDDVTGRKSEVIESALSAVTGTEIIRLVDRDDRSKQQILELNSKGTRVLHLRHLESYIFSDEILKKLATTLDKSDLIDSLFVEINSAKTKSVDRGNPADDLKSASGEIYLACKRVLSLPQSGNDAKSFMRDTLSPLVTSETLTFKNLREEIFEPNKASSRLV
jgi:energy-coupling factor transporter ATP-binding protein EcfA2